MSDRYRRRADVIWRRSLVAIHFLAADTEHVQTLAGSGPLIWELLESPATLDELLSAARSNLDTAPADIEADIARLLEELTTLGAIERADA
jgi:hypothetical protein